MKPLAVPPLAERTVIDYLTPLLASRGEDVTVGVNVPLTWTTGSKAHVQVGHDGTPEVHYPIYVVAAVRVTVWHASTTVAQNLANLCNALLLSHGGDGAVAGVSAGTGVLPVSDPDTGAELATIGVNVRLHCSVLS